MVFFFSRNLVHFFLQLLMGFRGHLVASATPQYLGWFSRIWKKRGLQRTSCSDTVGTQPSREGG